MAVPGRLLGSGSRQQGRPLLLLPTRRHPPATRQPPPALAPQFQSHVWAAQSSQQRGSYGGSSTLLPVQPRWRLPIPPGCRGQPREAAPAAVGRQPGRPCGRWRRAGGAAGAGAGGALLSAAAAAPATHHQRRAGAGVDARGAPLGRAGHAAPAAGLPAGAGPVAGEQSARMR